MPLNPACMLRGLAASVSVLTMAAAAHGQATIDNGSASAAQIGARLQGPGVTITNADIPAANLSDGPNMYGLFSNGIGGAGLQIDRGAALSTGSIASMFSANTTASASVSASGTQYNDPDLTAIETNARFNVAVVTMDVTLDPYVTGLALRYQFGSDEYPDYVGSRFNDLYAILLSGPGISGVENIARLPTSDGVVDINTINFGIRGCAQDGAVISTLDTPFYIRNGHTSTVSGATGFLVCNPATQPGPFPVTMQWNGLTSALTAERRGLTPGNTYRLKLAVADVLDTQYDSGAIFETITGLYDRDYGDAPNTGGYGNPYHVISSEHRLGPTVTPETDGYNSPLALGDVDDGVTIPGLQAGVPATITAAVTGAGGYLQAWFDWNNDGDFSDAGEQVALNLQDLDADGEISFTVTPPALATATNVFARFRWSTQANLSPTEPAPDGEVEDYLVPVGSASAPLSCPAGYTPISHTGHAGTVVTSAEFSANALGPILPAGGTTDNSNSARVNTGGNATLALRLQDIVPAGSSLLVSLARNNNPGNVAIDFSPDGSVWTQVATFSSPVNNQAQQIFIPVPAGSTEYVRFRRLGGRVWIDGVQYNMACRPAPPLTGAKSLSVYDPAAAGLYAVPGNDVIYTIQISNTGIVATDPDSIQLIDRIPAEIEIFNGPTPEFGGAVAGWAQSGTSLTFNPATDLRWSDALAPPADHAACTYVPAAGYDPAIRYACFNPKGVMPAGTPDPQFTVSLRGRIR